MAGKTIFVGVLLVLVGALMWWYVGFVNDGSSTLSIRYTNDQYGFTFSLPGNWEGYAVITDVWEGVTADASDASLHTQGPLLSIRHPLWTASQPRQDIPIMVFRLDQWNELQRGRFHIGAAPLGPSELGRNNRYVFALPARYNYAFLPGYEEVETILKSNPLHALN